MSERFPAIDSEETLAVATKVADIAMLVGRLTADFAEVDRVPRYANGDRENDVEHSYMLAVVAPEIARLLDLDLDIDKIRSFSLVHDLLEVKVGDVATFDLTSIELEEKERLEQVALKGLLSELPDLAAQSLEEYERQDTTEAVFVRMVDKILPVTVDITGSGVRVLQEDYGVTSYEDLLASHDILHTRIARKFGKDFPVLVAAHAVLSEIFEDKYRQDFEANSVEAKTRQPVEIERKFLINIATLPKAIDLNLVRSEQLQQGYIAVGADGSETRVRNINDERFELTVKSPGMISREEQNINISKEMFEGLWAQTGGRRVSKTRYYIPKEDGLTIELDIYSGALEGLATAEVEFDGRSTEATIRATTFSPPEWFGRDVSEDPTFKNHNLAAHVPHETIALVRSGINRVEQERNEQT